MSNKYNLYKNVNELCNILNQHGFQKRDLNLGKSYNYSTWHTDSENASTTFLVQICQQPEAFKFLEVRGEIKNRKICWLCGEQLSKLEYQFTQEKNNSIAFPICKQCYAAGAISEKPIKNLKPKQETFWRIPLFVSFGLFLYSIHGFTPGVDVEDYKLMLGSILMGIFFYYKSAINEEKNTFFRLINTGYGNNVLLSCYLIWFFLNLVILFMSDDGYYSASVLWPFHNSHVNDKNNELLKAYDFSEFIIYGGGPPLVFLVYKLLALKK